MPDFQKNEDLYFMKSKSPQSLDYVGHFCFPVPAGHLRTTGSQNHPNTEPNGELSNPQFDTEIHSNTVRVQSK